jgi:predicted dehydrogenase
VVIGSKKMVSFDDVSKRLEIYDRRVELTSGEPVPIRGEGVIVPFDETEPLRLECAAFLDSVKARRSPLTDGPSALRVLQVLEAAQRSLEQHGAPVLLEHDRAAAGSFV